MTKIKTGRPTKYSTKLASEICNAIASSSDGIKQLCKNNPRWPCADTIFTWLKDKSDFSDQYARAKKCQAELLIDEIIGIADDDSQDCIVNDYGKIIYNQTAINRAKLKIDTRKWIACKLVSKVYGANNSSKNNGDISKEGEDKSLQELLVFRARLNEKYKKDY